MKLRMSFVANSSSASYIVKIYGLTLKKFIDDIADEFCCSHFDREELIDVIKQSIKRTKHYMAKGSTIWKKSLDKNQKLLKILTDDKDNKNKKQLGIRNKQVIKKLLETYYGVKLNNEDDVITLTAFTSMHNDIGDVPEIMRNIVAFYVFSKYKVECEIEKDEDNIDMGI